jgi:hypothetical protein
VQRLDQFAANHQITSTQSSSRTHQLTDPSIAMASLRTPAAAGLMRAVATSRIASLPAARRFQSKVTQASGVVPEPITKNQPDYDIPADKATS